MATDSKSGRPKKSRDDKLVAEVTVAFLPAELAELRRQAQELGEREGRYVSVGSLVRMAVRAHLLGENST